MLLLNRTYTLDYCIDWMRYTLNSHSIMYGGVSIHLCKSLFVEGHDGIQYNQCFNLGDMPWRYKKKKHYLFLILYRPVAYRHFGTMEHLLVHENSQLIWITVMIYHIMHVSRRTKKALTNSHSRLNQNSSLTQISSYMISIPRWSDGKSFALRSRGREFESHGGHLFYSSFGVFDIWFCIFCFWL